MTVAEKEDSAKGKEVADPWEKGNFPSTTTFSAKDLGQFEMAQRLRLYFGSGRSNTAPDILEETSEEHSPGERDPASSTSEESPSQNFSRTLRLNSEPSLKRSSSMFIPQLSYYSETRPTKSSSMHISLQRANGFNNGDSSIRTEDVPPPSYRPRSPAPTYSEAQNQDIPLHPPPPYSTPEPSPDTAFTEPNLPKRRVFSIGSNGYTLYSRGQPSISVGGICIQRKSPDCSDVQHVRILPYGGAGWCVQQQSPDHTSATNEEPQRIVFQLQQNQSHNDNHQQQNVAHITTVKGNRIVRYPRIKLERSASHPRLYQHQKTSGDNEDAVQPGSEAEETKSRANGCVFNLSADSPRSKPRFKIFFNSGGGGDQNVLVGNGSTRSDAKVNINSSLSI